MVTKHSQVEFSRFAISHGCKLFVIGQDTLHYGLFTIFHGSYHLHARTEFVLVGCKLPVVGFARQFKGNIANVFFIW